MGLPWLPVVVVEEVAVGKLGRPESIGLTMFSGGFSGQIPDFLDFGPGFLESGPKNPENPWPVKSRR